MGSLLDKAESERGRRAIFKYGQSQKIKKEKANIECWQELLPGVAPHIVGFQDLELQASLLLEFLDSCTMQEVVLTASDEILSNVFFLLGETQLAG